MLAGIPGGVSERVIAQGLMEWCEGNLEQGGALEVFEAAAGRGTRPGATETQRGGMRGPPRFCPRGGRGRGRSAGVAVGGGAGACTEGSDRGEGQKGGGNGATPATHGGLLNA